MEIIVYNILKTVNIIHFKLLFNYYFKHHKENQIITIFDSFIRSF